MDGTTQSCNATYVRPRTRQRKPKAPPPLEPPHIEEDAAERKRVLNVLAQRRYRERKKQERRSEAAGKGSKKASPTSDDHFESHGSRNDQNAPCSAFLASEPVTAGTSGELGSSATGAALPMAELDLNDLQPLDITAQEIWCSDARGDSSVVGLMALGASASLNDEAAFSLAASTSSTNMISTNTTPHDTGDSNRHTPVSTGDPFSGCNMDMSLIRPDGGWSWPASSSSPSSSAGSPSSSSPTAVSHSSLSNSSATSTNGNPFAFLDSYNLRLPEMTLLRAFLRVAPRLNISPNIFTMEATSPFTSGGSNNNNTADAAPQLDLDLMLPANWLPTAAQIQIPHHPILDLIPWPSVRQRILVMFNLPMECRPEETKDPLALLNFAYDMEDATEGLKVWGDDPCDEGSWEVGQVFFERWWFCFDRGVVEQSNRLRRARGAECLKMRPVTK